MDFKPTPNNKYFFVRRTQATGESETVSFKYYKDGSVYLIGPSMEVVFEESPDAWKSAYKFIIEKGFVVDPLKPPKPFS